MEHLLNDQQRAAYQAFALNHSHHGGWRPIHLANGEARSSCTNCDAMWAAGIGVTKPGLPMPGILVVPDELLASMTLERAQAFLDDPDMAFSAGARWAVDESTHGELKRPTLGGRIAGTGAWVLDDLAMPDDVHAVTDEGVQYRPALRDPDGGCWTSWLNLPELAGLRAQLEAGARVMGGEASDSWWLPGPNRDELYLVLHATREAFCLAQHHVPPGQAERIDRLIRDVDRLGATYSLPGQWSDTNRTHLDPELPDQVRLEMSQGRDAAWARRLVAPVRERLMGLVNAVASSNFAVTPEVNEAAQDAVRYLAAIEAGDRTTVVATLASQQGPIRRMGVTMTDGQRTQADTLYKAGDLLGAQRVILDALTGPDETSIDQAQRDLDAGISIQVEAVHQALNASLVDDDGEAGPWTGLAASKLVRALDDLGWELTPQLHVAAGEPSEILTEVLGGSTATSLDILHRLALRGWALVDNRDTDSPEPGDDARALTVAAVADPVEQLGYRRIESLRLAVQYAASGGAVDPITYAREIDAYRDGPDQPGAFLPLDALEQLTAHLQGEANDVSHETHEALVVARAHARRAADAYAGRTNNGEAS